MRVWQGKYVHMHLRSGVYVNEDVISVCVCMWKSTDYFIYYLHATNQCTESFPNTCSSCETIPSLTTPHKKLTSSAENRHARTHISIQISQLSSTHQPLTQLLRKKKKEQTPTRKTMVPLSNPSPSPLPNNSRRPAQPSPAQRNARSDRNRNQECNERVEREIGRKGDG